MKKSLYLLSVVVVLSGLLSSSALGLSPLGPPKATLDRGRMSIGFDFAHSESDIKCTGLGLSGTLEDVESQLYLANLGLGLFDNYEMFVRLGTADHESEGYQGSSGFAYGWGSKLTVANGDPVSWGALFQMTWSESSDTLSVDVPPFGTVGADVDIDVMEIQIAFGPTYTQESFCIYGGPFLHFIDGDLDVSVWGLTVPFDLEQESEFGGYLGAQFDLAESSSLFIEYQMTDDASAIAGGLVWRF